MRCPKCNGQLTLDEIFDPKVKHECSTWKVSHKTQEKDMTALNKQEGGSHYELPIQPIEYIQANDLGYIEGNIIKYATRHRNKNGAEDIKKIIHYCQLLLELEYGTNYDQKEELRKPDSSEHRKGEKPPKPQFFAETYNKKGSV